MKKQLFFIVLISSILSSTQVKPMDKLYSLVEVLKKNQNKCYVAAGIGAALFLYKLYTSENTGRLQAKHDSLTKALKLQVAERDRLLQQTVSQEVEKIRRTLEEQQAEYAVQALNRLKLEQQAKEWKHKAELHEQREEQAVQARNQLLADQEAQADRQSFRAGLPGIDQSTQTDSEEETKSSHAFVGEPRSFQDLEAETKARIHKHRQSEIEILAIVAAQEKQAQELELQAAAEENKKDCEEEEEEEEDSAFEIAGALQQQTDSKEQIIDSDLAAIRRDQESLQMDAKAWEEISKASADSLELPDLEV